MEVIYMYLVGIDIAKYKHQCFITTEAGEVIKDFSFDNNYLGFKEFLNVLKSLDHSNEIRIGLEATGHYGTTLKQFISASGYTFMEFNPYLSKQFFKSLTIRKTKTDKVDARSLSSMLGSVDYKTLHTKYYHINELKSLVRARDTLICERSNHLVQITNQLDVIFPEFKPFFDNRLGKIPLFILKTYKSRDKISKLGKHHYEKIKSLFKGKLSYSKFLKLKELALSSIGVISNVRWSLLSSYINLYETLTIEIENIESSITSIMSLIDSKIPSIPGFSIITAATILAEAVDFNNFSNPQKLIAYAGLDVSIYQSGESLSYGKLVKRGSPLLRKTIWNQVLCSIRLIPTITDYYHLKKSQGKHDKVARTCVCRKLLRMIYHLESNKLDFDINNFR